MFCMSKQQCQIIHLRVLEMFGITRASIYSCQNKWPCASLGMNVGDHYHINLPRCSRFFAHGKPPSPLVNGFWILKWSHIWKLWCFMATPSQPNHPRFTSFDWINWKILKGCLSILILGILYSIKNLHSSLTALLQVSTLTFSAHFNNWPHHFY